MSKLLIQQKFQQKNERNSHQCNKNDLYIIFSSYLIVINDYRSDESS